jgi:glycosyltransferase involved in cell wall biosynthesis
LGELDGITVTGRVDDVRPYVAHAHAVAAPLRIARGIQNKVLEALAMEKVVLATPEAWEGIEDFDGRQGCIDGSPEALATAALRWLDTPIPVRVASARAMILRRHDWARNLDAYENVLGKAGSGPIPIDAMRAARLEACS